LIQDRNSVHFAVNLAAAPWSLVDIA
jgi:hypothetical protein